MKLGLDLNLNVMVTLLDYYSEIPENKVQVCTKPNILRQEIYQSLKTKKYKVSIKVACSILPQNAHNDLSHVGLFVL